MTKKPTLIVIAGPNGSGKTTVTAALRRDHWSDGVEYLNPDDVAQERFDGWNDPSSVLKAAEWVTKRREELLTARSGIAFETVFSAPDKVAFLERAQASGYFVRVFFVSTTDVKINASRVMGRFMDGGHSVPIDKIAKRYTKSMANLAAAIELADRVYLFDNSVDSAPARLCARTTEGAIRKIYGQLPQWVSDALEDLPKRDSFADLRIG